MKTGFHHSNESLGNEKSDMMEWQKANIAQNLRILVKDKLIITDDNTRYVSLPKQMFWEFLRELEHINTYWRARKFKPPQFAMYKKFNLHDLNKI